MLRAVTFDFWSTLFADSRGREREALRATVLEDALRAAGLRASGQAIGDSLRASWDYFDHVWLHERRTPSCAELVDAILGSLGAQLPAHLGEELIDRFERLVLEIPPEPMPGAVFTMPALAKRYRLAIICDTGYSPGAVLRELLDQHGLLGHFEYTYFSNEHGMSKPDTRVFLHVLEELGVRAVRGGPCRRHPAHGRRRSAGRRHGRGPLRRRQQRRRTTLHRRRHRQSLRRAAAGARQPQLCRLLTTCPA